MLESTSNKLPVRALVWSVLAAIAVYVGAALASDYAVIARSIGVLGVEIWLAILALSLVNYWLRFVRWSWYVARLGYRVPRWLHLGYYLAGFTFTTTPGKAGEAIRSLYLQQHGVSFTHSLSALFAERLLDLVAIVVLALAAVVAFPEFRAPVLLFAGLLVASLPILRSGALLRRARAWIDAVRSARLRAIGGHCVNLLASTRQLLESGPLYVGLIIGIVAWGAEGYAFWLILDALSISTTIFMAVAFYAISVLAGAASFIPGGLGTTEATMTLLLLLIGAEPPDALAATIICRLATLWFAVVIGGCMMATLSFQPRLRETA